jgi:ParB-like chromosome segregation protein Spo0J
MFWRSLCKQCVFDGMPKCRSGGIRKYRCKNFKPLHQNILKTVNVVDLKTDSQNPNKMSKEQHERLATSIKKWGFIVPIITNKDLLIADGEQRWTVAKSLGMKEVSVIRLPVEDVDRRLLRQVLNKLRGEH